ncbi:MAG: GWxTD domain-containing protein [Candidatus Acidiferrales bacterium]|jgi:GWxTD domain-containing protein
MREWARLGVVLLFSAIVLNSPVFAQQEGSTAPAQPQLSQKEQKKRSKKAFAELGEAYKTWLSEDVLYIITPDERKAFLQLSTNEEREQFIEQFWLRRNPNPDEQTNSFKEEHYRRIAYANEHFASGAPGWRTDRGRIYIMWGKPDEIESHPTGGNWDRPENQGGGSTETYPWEVWRYRHMEDIGENVELEFVDPTQSGEYHLTMDPGEKDALAHVPNAGLGTLEALGMASKADRYNRAGINTLPTPSGGADSYQAKEFEQLEQFYKVQAPPPVKYKDLEALVTSRIVRDQLKFTYRTDFLKVTNDTILVPVTVQIPNSEISYQNKEGVYSGSVNVFARVSTMTGRVVQTVEDVVKRDFPASLFQREMKQASIYQKTVPLRPGLYRLDLVLKDVQSGNVGVVNTRLAVPKFDEDTIQASTLILADQIERLPATQVGGSGQFVLGAMKVRPRLNQEFTTSDKMGIYLQIYNLKIDEKLHKSNAVVEYVVKRGNDSMFNLKETTTDLKQTGDQITIERLLPLDTLSPGKYSIEIKATDQVTNQTISRSSEFTVKAAPEVKAAVNSATGR